MPLLGCSWKWGGVYMGGGDWTFLPKVPSAVWSLEFALPWIRLSQDHNVPFSERLTLNNIWFPGPSRTSYFPSQRQTNPPPHPRPSAPLPQPPFTIRNVLNMTSPYPPFFTFSPQIDEFSSLFSAISSLSNTRRIA